MSLIAEECMAYTGNYTIGGYLAEKAEHWCEKNYQKLGNFIYQMMCGKHSSRLKAQCEIYDLRRHFMRDEWNSYITKLEEHRAKRGAVSVSSYFDQITEETILGYPGECTEVIVETVELKETVINECNISIKPDVEPVVFAKVVSKPNVYTKEEIVEQLSLF
jgi:hypothetical protein